jgi:tetratricopeptide (TPR) repeat protein
LTNTGFLNIFELTMRLKYLALFLCVLPALLRAQPSRRAIKYYTKGENYKAHKNYPKACKYLQRSIDLAPTYDDAYGLLGGWYYDAQAFESAGNTFAAGAQYCNKGKERFALPAARSYMRAQKLDTALYWLSLVNTPKGLVEAAKLKAQVMLMKRLIAQHVQDTNQVYNLGSRINSRYAETFPSLASDKQTLYFTRRVNGIDEDFYFAKPDSCGGWFAARNMGSPPNTSAQEGAQAISSDDHYLFFMRNENRSENGWALGGYDLYMAYRIACDSPWSVPQSFGATINTPAFEGMPSLSPDINDLYFVSDRPGGYGGKDIWVTRFEQGLWQLPRNLGPGVNTSGNETAPFIAADNKTLYFSSDGHPGLGASDLFISHKITDTVWTPAENLGYPINSPADDNSMFVTADGKTVLFASDRDKMAGDFDIYETTLPERLLPQSTAYVLCYIYDSISKRPAEYGGSVTLYDSLGNEWAMYHGNRGDGSLLMSLPLNTSFSYEAKGFSCKPSTGTLIFTEACPVACTTSFALLPSDYVKPLTDTFLMSLQFHKNITALTDSQQHALVAALAPWMGRTDVVVMINCYTDNSGTPMINEEKSAVRAQSVAAVVEAAGFLPGTIIASGFGEANPLVPNDTPENQDKNRRAEIIVRQ